MLSSLQRGQREFGAAHDWQLDHPPSIEKTTTLLPRTASAKASTTRFGRSGRRKGSVHWSDLAGMDGETRPRNQTRRVSDDRGNRFYVAELGDAAGVA
ncbi:hypothetical protein [Mesorhizobium sp. M0213]|uniref:hypothetical protein n=1 Tax=Mesorhizobium sp. M0213 TaxID=2956917 RepID=UPI00333A16B4